MKQHLLLLIWALSSTKETASSGVIDARLVNGNTQCSGRLEMKHQGQWRTLKVRSNRGSSQVGFAELACRQTGCGSAVSVQFHPNVTEPKPAWEVYFSCKGTDQTIRQCKETASRKKVDAVDSYVSSTMVKCSETLRINSDHVSCSGTVMVKSDQDWLHVCVAETSRVDPSTAKMMCAELGCGSARRAEPSTRQTASPSRNIQCVGNETQLQQCPSTAHSDCQNVLILSCDYSYSIRLAGGDDKCSGTLEGKNGVEWRPLTLGWRSFRESQLSQLCDELGCGAIISSTSLYLPEHLPLWEITSECNPSPLICKKWVHEEAHAVLTISCTAAVRLVRGRNRCTGYVQVKYDGSWRHLCHNAFTLLHGLVGCRDLSCGFPQYFTSSNLKHTIKDTLNISCSGQEEHLVDCPVSSLPAEGSDHECIPAFLTCDTKPMKPEMTMFSSPAEEELRGLTVYRGHRVLVACHITSPSPVNSFTLKFYSGGSIVLLGNKTAVDNAAHFVLDAAEQSQEGDYYCSYDYESNHGTFSEPRQFVLRTREASYVRLAGAQSRCLGSLELQHKEEWRPVSQQQWSLKEASVVCRQLGCGSVAHTHTQGSLNELQPVWRFYSDCEGSERALLGCGSVREGMSISTVHVLCSDIFLPVVISVESETNSTGEDPIVVYSPYRFYINCSVTPQFPGGGFSLIFNGNNSIRTMNQTAVNHSSIFSFDLAEKAHAGNYSCIYYNTVFGHYYSSQSQELSVAVEDAEDVMLDDIANTFCSGTLFVKQRGSDRMMVSAETVKWDMRHASIVCRQLGCGDAVSTSKVKLPQVTSMWRFFSDCDGTEAALLQCGDVFPWFSSTAIQVVCVGKM